MAEIRADIREKGLTDEMLSFADVPCEANPQNPAEHYDPDLLQANIRYISENYKLRTYRVINEGGLPQLFKKLMRKLIRFYVDPIAEDQSTVNANTAQALQQMEHYIRDTQSHSNAELSRQLTALELQQKNNRLEIDRLQNQVKQLSRQLEQLRKEQS